MEKRHGRGCPSFQEGPRLDIPKGTVPDLIAAQAARAPDRTAIEWSGGTPWSYSQLMQWADALACDLIARGVQHNELVGVCLPRRPEMVAATLAVMRAGAAYLPLDPAYPHQRLRYMAEEARVQQILVWRETDVTDALASNSKLLPLATFEPGSVANAALPVLNGDDLAYVLFTSGSTGLPKGVRVLHRNLMNLLSSLSHTPGINPDDVMGAFTSLAFDPSVQELFLPLLVGARIVVATETEQARPDAATMLMRNFPMTLLQSSPLTLRLMAGNHRLDELRGVRLWVGGEAMPRDIANLVLGSCDELWNMYGPTETTVTATMYCVTPGPNPVPIGTPLANTTIYLLDESLSPVTEGETGEIWIGGAGVADGYLNDSYKTTERFLPDPFARDGSRMYRTGDLGRLHAEVLYCHGRADDQISLHGARIEPAEIEAVALATSGVHQAVVVATDLGDGDPRLILYMVADSDPSLEVRLRAALHASLPTVMLPRYIEMLETLPLTPNGKVDRKALPLPKSVMDYNAATKTRAPGTFSFPSSGTSHSNHWSPLVPLQPRGTRPPLFLIHALGGNVLNYAPLARGLGADQPVYGIQAIGLDGVTPPVSSLQTMAACYVSEIQRVQPHGPYFLGGGSMGGLVAYEIAQQLREQGETIGLLAMIDTYGPDCWHDNPSLRKPLPLRIASSLFWKPVRMLDALRARHARATGRVLPLGLCLREIERVHFGALAAYVPQPCVGGLVLFRGSEQPASTRQAETLGWGSCVQGEIKVIEIPGNHDNMIEQPELLRRLRLVLRNAQDSAAQALGSERPVPKDRTRERG